MTRKNIFTFDVSACYVYIYIYIYIYIYTHTHTHVYMYLYKSILYIHILLYMSLWPTASWDYAKCAALNVEMRMEIYFKIITKNSTIVVVM